VAVLSSLERSFNL